MACDPSSFSAIGSGVWRYSAPATMGELAAAGYFETVSAGLKPGDIILATLADNGGPVVLSVDGVDLVERTVETPSARVRLFSLLAE
jgi:archaeosine-15-forming tRNA-guanine transglycosylase